MLHYLSLPIFIKYFRLDLQAENLRWDTGEMPRSICSDPCPVGHVRNYQVSFVFLIFLYNFF